MAHVLAPHRAHLPGLGFLVSAQGVPITLGLDGIRQCLFGTEMGFIPLWQELVILILLAGLFFLLAKYSLARMENLGKKEGRLTLKWQ